MAAERGGREQRPVRHRRRRLNRIAWNGLPDEKERMSTKTTAVKKNKRTDTEKKKKGRETKAASVAGDVSIKANDKLVQRRRNWSSAEAPAAGDFFRPESTRRLGKKKKNPPRNGRRLFLFRIPPADYSDRDQRRVDDDSEQLFFLFGHEIRGAGAENESQLCERCRGGQDRPQDESNDDQIQLRLPCGNVFFFKSSMKPPFF